MGRQYRQPPVVKATCEIHFARDTPWDLTMIGPIYDGVKRSFSVRQPVEASPEAEATKSEALPLEPRFDMQFWRKDNSAYMAIGAHIIAVTMLPPYSSWVTFRSRIMRGVTVYQKVAQPSSINHIILQYSNKFSVPAQANLREYFQFLPYLASGTNRPNRVSSFIVGVEIPYEEGRDYLRATLATIESSTPNILAAQLDLEYLTVKHGAIPFSDLGAWLDAAHDRVEDTFEAAIAPVLRATFDAEGDNK